MIPIGHGVIIPQLTTIVNRVSLVIGRIEQERQRHFEYFGNLEFIEAQIERRSDQSNNGSDLETGTGAVFGQVTDDLDMTSGEADFFGRFPKSGFSGRSIAFFATPTWKADLSRVVLQVCGALGQQHRWFQGAVHDRKQHRGRGQRFVADPILEYKRM